jgi:rubredoxin
MQTTVTRYYDNVYGTGWNTYPTTYGGWTCPSCGVFVPYGQYHICYRPFYLGPYQPAPSFYAKIREGWKCPKCGRIYSPWIEQCRICYLEGKGIAIEAKE